MTHDPAFIALADRLDAYEAQRRGWGVLKPAMEEGAVEDADLATLLEKTRRGNDAETVDLIEELMRFPVERRRWFSGLHQFFTRGAPYPKTTAAGD